MNPETAVDRNTVHSRSSFPRKRESRDGGFEATFLDSLSFPRRRELRGNDEILGLCAYPNCIAVNRLQPSRQRGISLFVVMVILMLALILVLGGLSITSLNESFVGNQSDAQRAYGSAQALLDAAQRDIRLNGRFCNGKQNPNFTVTAGDPPAPTAAPCTPRFPRDMDEYGNMLTAATGLGHCAGGVCISKGPADPKFATDQINNGKSPEDAPQQKTTGAGYTEFIAVLDKAGAEGTAYGGGATTGDGATLAASGTYWVEIFPYNVNSVALGGGRVPGVPDPAYPFVFRITALAQGLRGGTQTVLRTYYTPYTTTQ